MQRPADVDVGCQFQVHDSKTLCGSLCGQEKARFQGIGDRDFFKHSMDRLGEKRLADMAGNSLFSKHST